MKYNWGSKLCAYFYNCNNNLLFAVYQKIRYDICNNLLIYNCY